MLDPRVAPGVHRIDAGRRAQVVAEREIGSGKADRAAAAVAMLHPSLDLPGAAEQLDGLARPAFAQVRTNDGGGVDLALAGHHRPDGSVAEPVLGALRPTGKASCRVRVCKSVLYWVGAVFIPKKYKPCSYFNHSMPQ